MVESGAFGTQLLCEQVVGRGLRRMSYVTEPSTISINGQPVTFEAFPVEYAEVYGVPFSFIPCSGAADGPKPGPMPTRVRALPDRMACEITFPRLMGYRYDLPGEQLIAHFTDDAKTVLTTADIPYKTENAPIVGELSIHTLDDLKRHREQEVAFLLAKLVLEKYFQDEAGNVKLTVLPARMNPDLAMGDELLKKTGAGNLFMVFGEPDVDVKKQQDGKIVVKINGLDIYDSTTGQIRSSSTDDIACWFIDTQLQRGKFLRPPLTSPAPTNPTIN